MLPKSFGGTNFIAYKNVVSPSLNFHPRKKKKEKKKKNFGPSNGAGVNNVYVRRTSAATPQGSDVGCDTTSPFAGSRHYVSN